MTQNFAQPYGRHYDLVDRAIDVAKLNRPASETSRHWRVAFAREACEALLGLLEDEGLVTDPKVDETVGGVAV